MAQVEVDAMVRDGTKISIDATSYGENIENVEHHHWRGEASLPGSGTHGTPTMSPDGKIGPSATTGFEAQKFAGRPLAIITVGLPGRGKSYIARRIMRFLSWLGLKTAVFQVHAYRRQFIGKDTDVADPEFFDHSNAKFNEVRDTIVVKALDDMIDWMKKGGNVGILDGQNVQQQRRDLIFRKLSSVLDRDRILFLEVGETDAFRLATYKTLTLKTSTGYCDLAESKASTAFDQRVQHYAAAYGPLSAETPFIRVNNAGSDIEINRVHGYVPCRVANFLMNVNLSMKPIFLSRHGQSEYNLLGRIGGDSGLTDFGEQYAQELAKFMIEQGRTSTETEGLEVWCSTLLRTRMTALPLSGMFPTIYWRALEEIDAGVYDGLTYEEIQEQATEEFNKRKQNKYWYRYPHGESYHDLVARLEPVIMELERSKRPLLIISHQAVLRVIYAYIVDSKPELCTNLSMPLHTVVRVRPTYDGKFEETRFPILETDPAVAQVGTHGKEEVVALREKN